MLPGLSSGPAHVPRVRPLRLRLAGRLLLVTGMATLPLPAARRVELRSFDRIQLLETTSETSASVSLGDIDHDGDLDVILAKGRHWPLRNLVLRNDGHARFTTEAIGDSADRTYTAALADLNGDGTLDLVVSNDRPDRKLVYLSDATGHFRAAGTFGQAEWSTRYVTVADLNGDKRPDIIVANRNGNSPVPRPSFVCMNDGAASFPVCTPLATQSATIIVASDLDGDGHVDLFVPHRDGGQSLIFWNDGSGTFTAAGVPIGASHVSVRAAAAAESLVPPKGRARCSSTRVAVRGSASRRFRGMTARAWCTASPSAISMEMAGRISQWHARTHRTRSGSMARR